jgi:uncharacterized DUF497 family protein
VEFEWDPRKEASNVRKHGIPFSYAARVFLDAGRVERIDEREDYEETRFVTTGLVDGMEMVVVYTMREERVRIISAREADRDEIKTYWSG